MSQYEALFDATSGPLRAWVGAHSSRVRDRVDAAIAPYRAAEKKAKAALARAEKAALAGDREGVIRARDAVYKAEADSYHQFNGDAYVKKITRFIEVAERTARDVQSRARQAEMETLREEDRRAKSRYEWMKSR